MRNALLAVGASVIQSCCSCRDHPARLPIVAATEAAQLALIECGVDPTTQLMGFGDFEEYWRDSLADANDPEGTVLGDAKRRAQSKDCFLITFGDNDERPGGGGYFVIVSKHPIEVLAVIAQV